MWRYEFGFLQDQQTKDPHEKVVFDCAEDDDAAAVNFYVFHKGWEALISRIEKNKLPDWFTAGV